MSIHAIPCHSLSFRAIRVAPCHGSKSPSFHSLPTRPSLPPTSSPPPQQASNDSTALHPSELPSLNTKPTAAASTPIPTPPTTRTPSLSSLLPSPLPRSVLLPLLAAAIAAATFFSSLSWRLGGGGGAPFAALLRPPPAAAASNQIVLTPPPPGTASPAALKSPQQRAGITDKALYAIDLFLTTEPSGKLLLLSVLWVALMLLGAGAFIAAAKATNEDVPFGEAVWVSWTMLSDPGQQGAQSPTIKGLLLLTLPVPVLVGLDMEAGAVSGADTKGLLLLALLVGLAAVTFPVPPPSLFTSPALRSPPTSPPQDSIWKRVLSVVLTIKGLLLLALLVGLATDGVAKQVDDLNKGKGAVMERGHVLVVGWTPRTIPLVQQLVGADGSRAVVVLASGKGKEEMDSALLDAIPKSERQKAGGGQVRGKGGKRVKIGKRVNTVAPPEVVVVLAGGKGKEKMDSALLDAIPKSERQKAGGGQIVTRTGSPFHSEDLARCAADAARSIVLLSPPVSDPSQADAFVIQASLALANRADISADIIAELSSLSNVRLLQRLHRTLLAPSPSTTATTAQAPPTGMRGRRRRLVPVAAENLSLRTLLSAAVHRGTADVTADLLDFENDEFYFKEWPELVGRTFGDALFLFDNATPCGLMKAPKHHTAPDASGSAGSTMGEVLVNPPSWTLIEPGDKLLVIAADRNSYRPGPSRLPPPPSELTAAAVPAATQKAPRGTSSSSVGRKQHVLICGWRPEAKQLVELLPSILAQGSEVTVVATHISPTDELLLGNIRRHKKLPIRIKRGSPADREVLESLPLETVDSVILLQSTQVNGGENGEDEEEDAGMVDSSQATVTALLIRSIQAARGRAQEAAIVAEVPASERDVARQVERHALDGAVCPEHLEAQVLAQITHDPGEMGQAGHLEAQVLAQITHDPDVGTVLDEIIGSERNRMAVRRAASTREENVSKAHIHQTTLPPSPPPTPLCFHIKALCIPYLSTHPSSPFPSSPSPPLFLVVSTTARCWNDVGTVLDEIIGSERNRMAVRRADEFIGEHEAGIFNLWEMQPQRSSPLPPLHQPNSSPPDPPPSSPPTTRRGCA
ncbi:unnamed protein product [Closterium sp. NIES-65]|nr:unnamed protein product [Closterium sp. NIES-65]